MIKREDKLKAAIP